MKHAFSTICVAVLASVIVACSDEALTNATLGPQDALVRTGNEGMPLPLPLDSIFEDEPMMAVAHHLPDSFGGFWYDEEGQIVVGLTDPGHLALAVSSIRSWIGANQPTAYVAEKIQYPFLQLAAYRTLLRRHVFKIDGVVALGVNESDNRVKVGVSSGSAEDQVRQLVTEMDIPLETVMFQIMDSPRLTSLELVDEHPDGVAQAGWRINRATGGECTLGFVARDPSDGNADVFVTNSHCSALRAELDGGTMWQPDFNDTYLGFEILDPDPHTCGYPGFTDDCREADAALFSANADIQFGTIARTTTQSACDNCSAGIVVDSMNPSILITGRQNHVFENETLQKIGATTGWT